jgi:hypothetical protein
MLAGGLTIVIVPVMCSETAKFEHADKLPRVELVTTAASRIAVTCAESSRPSAVLGSSNVTTERTTSPTAEQLAWSRLPVERPSAESRRRPSIGAITRVRLRTDCVRFPNARVRMASTAVRCSGGTPSQVSEMPASVAVAGRRECKLDDLCSAVRTPSPLCSQLRLVSRMLDEFATTCSVAYFRPLRRADAWHIVYVEVGCSARDSVRFCVPSLRSGSTTPSTSPLRFTSTFSLPSAPV